MAQAAVITPEFLVEGDADFTLDPEEVAKGRLAAERFLEGLRPGDQRRTAEEALETLALIISDGACGRNEFPWQQVRAFHSAAALALLKSRRAPARVEDHRCQRESGRKYHAAPEIFNTQQIQKMRSILGRVVKECADLGFTSEPVAPVARSVRGAKTRTSAPSERIVTDAEFRALRHNCMCERTVVSRRDALMLALCREGALTAQDLTRLTVADLCFDSRTSQVTVILPSPKGRRGRKTALDNRTLISLEDWLDRRTLGECDPLLCPVKKNGVVENRRMTAAEVKEACTRRAELAGVEDFSPKDLGRGSEVTRKRSTRKAPEPSVGLLFSNSDGDRTQPETFLFPYAMPEKE